MVFYHLCSEKSMADPDFQQVLEKQRQSSGGGAKPQEHDIEAMLKLYTPCLLLLLQIKDKILLFTDYFCTLRGSPSSRNSADTIYINIGQNFPA